MSDTSSSKKSGAQTKNSDVSTLQDFYGVLAQAKMSGASEVEVSLEVLDMLTRGSYDGSTGRIYFEGVCVWEAGKKEATLLKDSRNIDDILNAGSKIKDIAAIGPARQSE